jgi:rieske iron-sulfur protein
MSEHHRVPAAASPNLRRRTVLQSAAGLVLAWMTPIHASQDPKEARPAIGDWLVRKDDASLIPLTPDDVPFDGRALLAWPLAPKGDILRDGSPNNTIVLARLNPSTLSTFTRSQAVDDVVAYSAICTHSGCEVDDTLGDSHTLFCSCHGSIFDPRDGGAAIGGPAPRPLPSLPLKLVEGRLVVAGPFTAEPGFGF